MSRSCNTPEWDYATNRPIISKTEIKSEIKSENKSEIPVHINKIQLFLGRMLLEVVKKTVHEHKRELYGLAKDSKFQISYYGCRRKWFSSL